MADETETESLMKRFGTFLRKADPVAAAAADLEGLLADHGHEAVMAALAKSSPDEPDPEGLNVDDLELTDDDLKALGLTRVVKAEPDPIGDRLTAIEAALAKLANLDATPAEPVTKASPDIISLVKQGVPPHAIEDAKGLLEHADADVRQAAADMLVKQADPRIVALLKGEAGNAAIPADDTEKDQILKQLAARDGNGVGTKTEAAKILAQLAANGGGA